jgi:hypothetical protein
VALGPTLQQAADGIVLESNDPIMPVAHEIADLTTGASPPTERRSSSGRDIWWLAHKCRMVCGAKEQVESRGLVGIRVSTNLGQPI